MGSASHEMLQTVLAIIFTLLLSLHTEYISMVDASCKPPVVQQYLKVEDQKELYFIEGSRGIKENRMKDVAAGKDDHEEQETFVLKKLRALFGLTSLHKINPSNDAISPAPSPSPSPAPYPLPSTTHYYAKSPAPAPKVKPIALHPRHRHASPHSSPILQLHQYHGHSDEAKDREKRVLITTFVSIGATLLICGLGFCWVIRRFYKHRKKKPTRTVSVYSSNGGGGSGQRRKCSSGSQSKAAAAAGKVSYDPGFDLFYLNTLSTVLEPQTCDLETSEYVNTKWSLEGDTSNCYALHEKEDLRHEPISTDHQPKEGRRCYEAKNMRFTENGCSSAEEIISVHEYAESVKYESDGHNSSICDPEIIPIDRSDNESFHSLCNSHSSISARLSNASSENNSLCDTVQCFSPVTSNKSPVSTSSTKSYPSIAPNTQECQQQIPTPRPPPPPPPPPPTTSALLSNSSSTWLAQVKYKEEQNTSSSRNPSASNQCLEGDSQNSELQRPKPPTNIPPPIFKGSKGPPPPPVPLSQFAPLGKDGVPLPKLKPLHWDKLRATTDRSMVWDKLRTSSFELDEEMIESLFGYNIQNVFKNDEGKSKTPSPTKHVLEPKRLQNITILSKALNVTAEQVCNALIEGEGLSLQQLEAMVKMEPTKEEEAKLSNYKSDVNELGSAEKLVKAMLTIPFAFQRIEAMLYRATFNDEVIHLRNSFSMLEEACNELRSSRLFLKLLEAVLKTGNRMNVGTIRGGAKAFKLDALLKLSDVKGTDGKTTLLHFVVQEIIRSEGIRMSESIIGKINQQNKKRVEEKEEHYRRMGLELVSGLSTELCNVKKTASLDIDVLATSVSSLSDGMIKIQQLVDKDLGGSDRRCVNFVHGIMSFVNHAEKKLKQLKEDEDKVLQSVREVTEYFHGDVSKEEANPLRIFVIVRDFLGMLDQVCRELRSLEVPRSHNPLAPFR